MKRSHESTNAAVDLGRRSVLKGLGAGLTLGVWLPQLARAEAADAASAGAAKPPGFPPNAFVRIAADDSVTVICKHIEFGQGPYTGLATLVAEELDADWSQMRAEAAPADAALYANFAFGVQGTGGSTAMANSYTQMRQVGAALRAMLIAAAAAEWQVPAAEISISKGQIMHAASGKAAGFGAFADQAALQSPPAEPVLKQPRDFRLIGTRLPKLDTPGKINGNAEFTMDVQRDGQLMVVVAHPPRFGATVAKFDDTATRAVAGVVDVRAIPQGVAVYANSTYAAIQGRTALKVDWDDSKAETRSSAVITATYREAVSHPGKQVETRGDSAAALAASATRLEAFYEFPFLAHAPMEPLDAVMTLKAGQVEVWMGSQLQTIDHAVIAKVMELPQSNITLHTLMAGGSFGRRATPDGGLAAEAAMALKALGRDATIKLVYTREDDIQGGRYRPIVVHRLVGGLSEKGEITAWENTIATQSIMAGTPFAGMIQDGIDPTSVEGSRGLPYRIPDFHCSLHDMQCGVPPLWWRSVGHTHTAYATETFLDELLERAGKDPVAGRRALLEGQPRYLGVLDRVAALAEAAGAVPEGRARGLAMQKSFESYVAQIAEVSKGDDGLPRVHRVWCAVDCGLAINPDVIVAQMEGGIGYGLGAVLYGAINLEDGGAIRERNFDAYRSLRINEMPAIEVAIVASAEPPTGVGEPGVPPIGPAVANAWRRLTGVAVRSLPFSTASKS